MPAPDSPVLTASLRGELRGWAALAVAALAVAGIFALLLAFARTPKLQNLLPWPWEQFFFKALVTHVVYSMVVWFLGALGALTVLSTARISGGHPRAGSLGPVGMWTAVAGFALLSTPALLNQGEPSLNNYVPVLVHPLYYAGLGLLGGGLALGVLRLLLNLPGAARIEASDWGVASAGTVFLMALACFGLASALIPPDTGEAAFNERLFWGGGHVLQFVNTLLAMVGWQVLSERTLGEPPVGPRLFAASAAVLVLAVLPAPLFYAAFDVLGREHRDAFTQLLWYGLSLPPAVVLLGALGLTARRRSSLPWRSPAFVGLILSLVLFAAGGVMGFFLGVGDTRTPSHYHASLGAVNLALMALYFSLLLPLLGLPARRDGPVRWSFLLYGVGQILFSIGMFVAGAAGVPRKTAGVEQHLDSFAKYASMLVYGSGGVIAVVGGILFVWLASARLLSRRTP
ncbi:MAG: cbb3-type cytochrome c oxidase subunit I [Alphaproteobacteria bacterium]|nr:cbb3-type cytochrome c oxidase subunit I [Alphaproteobacteria bacterium]